MDPEDTMLSEVCQSQKDNYWMFPFTWGVWNSQVHRSKEWDDGCQRLWGDRNGELVSNGHEVSLKQNV